MKEQTSKAFSSSGCSSSEFYPVVGWTDKLKKAQLLTVMPKFNLDTEDCRLDEALGGNILYVKDNIEPITSRLAIDKRTQNINLRESRTTPDWNTRSNYSNSVIDESATIYVYSDAFKFRNPATSKYFGPGIPYSSLRQQESHLHFQQHRYYKTNMDEEINVEHKVIVNPSELCIGLEYIDATKERYDAREENYKLNILNRFSGNIHVKSTNTEDLTGFKRSHTLSERQRNYIKGDDKEKMMAEREFALTQGNTTIPKNALRPLVIKLLKCNLEKGVRAQENAGQLETRERIYQPPLNGATGGIHH
ncbi:hypothetical protein J6590_073837 [Homalodisca vitripennis]|nr:hypothetical protein J6590_073837 [Homalodisca vitripennis]